MPPIRRPRFRLLSIELRSVTGHRIVACVEWPNGRGQPPQLILRGGMWRVELPPEEMRRLADFAAGWCEREP